MRNSVMPLIMVAAVVIGAVWLLNGESKPGVNGPDLYPGIFRLPKEKKFSIFRWFLKDNTKVESAVTSNSNEVKVDGELPANRGESWRVVQVVAKDNHALTRSVVLGLGEQLTGHGCVTLIAPVDAPAFPIGVARIITVATDQAEIPPTLGGEARASLRITSQLARLPDGHPAATLLPLPEGPIAVVLTVTHHTAVASGVSGWPSWWAALGRGIADTVIDKLAPGGLPKVVDPATRARLPTLVPLADWGTALGQAPTTERLRWDFAFQEPLIRGWVGHVTSLTVADAKGVEKPTLDQLLERMTAGKWDEVGVTSSEKPTIRLFTRSHEGHSEWFSIGMREAGWSVACWQERSGIPDLFSEWAAAAEKGDVGSKLLLHAHRDCPLMPPDLRAAAQAAPANTP